MKNVLLILVFTFATPMLCNAQTIEIEKVFGGYKYTQNGERLKINDLETIQSP